MSKAAGDDILNLDFDPDVLIDLIGKLSLDAIPLDVSDTLLNLENKMETSLQISGFYHEPYSFVPCSSADVPSICAQTESPTETVPPVDLEKERFLSSIGLSARKPSKPPKKPPASGKELSYILNRLEPPDSEFDPVPEDPPSSPHVPVFVEDDVLCLPNEEFDAVVRGFLSNLCDKKTLSGGELTFPPVTMSDFQPVTVSDFQPVTVSDFQLVTVSDFQPVTVSDFQPVALSNFQPVTTSDFQQPVNVTNLPSATVSDFSPVAVSDFLPVTVSDFPPVSASDFPPVPMPNFQPSNHTFDPPFHEIFQHRVGGSNVIDINLNTLDCRPKYDHTSSLLSEVSSDSDGSFPSLGSYSQEGVCSENSQTSSVDKFVCSPDSGYTSCSSVISPCSLTDPSDTQCLYDLSEEDDHFNELVAALIEVESNFNWSATHPPSSSSSSVPVLSRSGDPEDYKERILNFLKAPLPAEEQPSPPRPDDGKESASLPLLALEPLSENGPEEKFSCFNLMKKTYPKVKESKQGFEFRYASKNELRHSNLLSKLKLHTEKSKILKQIQEEDEREQKRLKVIQMLDRRLKRASAVDDRENKRRKVQCKEA